MEVVVLVDEGQQSVLGGTCMTEGEREHLQLGGREGGREGEREGWR